MSSPDKDGNMQSPDDGGTCCRRCEEASFTAHGYGPFERMTKRAFIVCGTCGNKRCPKATNHELECTDSNATGQPGSDYE